MQSSPLRWFKGNTHTHTINSDGDSTPDDVVKWYREHGYNFLVLTDHEFVTNVVGLNSLHGKASHFLVISGQEITDSFNKKPHHANGLGLQKAIMPQKGDSVVSTIQRDVDAIREADGVPQINHPNFGWALNAESLRQVNNVSLFEVYNGHPLVNNVGGGDSPGTEEIWDTVLSAGKLIYGVATDDAHHFKRIGDRTASTPGHGWVVVRAAELTAGSILPAMEKGDFYASTGVELDELVTDGRSIAIKVKEQRWSKYRIQFIGKNGRILAEYSSGAASYTIKGDEGYVRAKVIESNGNIAWIQPVLVTVQK
ncbi:MAG: CehA/McbA family metallohydrolase [Pyrinomonadaceae bacterium]